MLASWACLAAATGRTEIDAVTDAQEHDAIIDEVRLAEWRRASNPTLAAMYANEELGAPNHFSGDELDELADAGEAEARNNEQMGALSTAAPRHPVIETRWDPDDAQDDVSAWW